MSEALADEFARQLAEDADDNDFGCWATDNRDRILAALRVADEHGTVRRAENARIARIVREPTDEQANSIGFEALEADGDRTFQLEGRAACHRILALANEAGERDE